MATHKASKQAKAAYNARRREIRAAQRYLKKANASTGAVAEKNRALAKKHFEQAMETYDIGSKQKFSSSVINVGAALGIDVQGQRASYVTTKNNIQEAIKRSELALEKNLKDPNKRLEAETRLLISDTAIGKRVMGGLVDVWRDKVKTGASAAENRAAAEKAIFEYMHASSWVEVLNKLEQSIGSELYSIALDLEMYDVVRIAIQKHVTGNTLIS